MFVMLPIFSIIMFVYGVRSDGECLGKKNILVMISVKKLDSGCLIF